MSYAVVIVNWNGADDTIACLASFLDNSPDARAIVVDNGSADDSLVRIAAALQARAVQFEQFADADADADAAGAARSNARVLLIAERENLGFAGGCNVGLRVAAAAGLAVTVFLNNDTVVEGGALDRIVERLTTDAGCFACLPMLVVWGSDRVWNCGGSVYRIGLRRYHCAGRSRHDVAALGEIRCSFFTGCCFAVRTEGFMRRAGFSERFFFGEEDFELALWMKERGRTAVCLLSAIVQHKVSMSFNAAAGSRQNAKMFIYYLNRFIHMRLRFGRLRWWLWLAAYLPYVACLLWRSGDWREDGVLRFLRRLVGRARVMDRVTRSDFEAVMAGRRMA